MAPPDRIEIRFFAAAREAAGVRETSVAAGSVADVCHTLSREHGDGLRRVLDVSSLLIDGRTVSTRSSEIITAGTVVEVLPPFAGG